MRRICMIVQGWVVWVQSYCVGELSNLGASAAIVHKSQGFESAGLCGEMSGTHRALVWCLSRYGGGGCEMFPWTVPQTVCPHYGVLTVRERSGVLGGVLPQRRLSTAQARTEFRLHRQCAVDRRSRDFGSFYRVSVHFLEQNVVLRHRRRRSDGFRRSKRDFTWQVQGIGHFVKIVAGAVFCGRCENVGRRVSFEGLRFTWRAQGIRTMDAMFWGRRARFLRRVAFLELELEDQFAWPVQHFVWPQVMISWQAQYFRNMFQFSWKSRRNARFGSPDLQFSRKSRRKRLFWKSRSSVFEEVSQNLLALEVRIFSFRGSLAQNARFGAPDLQFSWESRIRRSFWKPGSSVFEEASQNLLALEVRIFSFRGSLAENVRFGSPELQFSRKSRTKRSFWSSGSSVFEEVSHKTLLLEARVFSFRGSLAEFARLQYLDASGPKVDPNTEILRQRSCRSGPTGSW